MRAVRVFDGEIVQAEFFLHSREEFFARLVQPDPDEAAGLLKHLADLAKLDVLVPLAVGVSDTFDDSLGHGCSVLPEPGPRGKRKARRALPAAGAAGRTLIQSKVNYASNAKAS